MRAAIQENNSCVLGRSALDPAPVLRLASKSGRTARSPKGATGYSNDPANSLLD
jgi:hypothetical protein